MTLNFKTPQTETRDKCPYCRPIQVPIPPNGQSKLYNLQTDPASLLQGVPVPQTAHSHPAALVQSVCAPHSIMSCIHLCNCYLTESLQCVGPASPRDQGSFTLEITLVTNYTCDFLTAVCLLRCQHSDIPSSGTECLPCSPATSGHSSVPDSSHHSICVCWLKE